MSRWLEVRAKPENFSISERTLKKSEKKYAAVEALLMLIRGGD